MDPLAELVKIDPKSIGVGQYQHDVRPECFKEKPGPDCGKLRKYGGSQCEYGQ